MQAPDIAPDNTASVDVSGRVSFDRTGSIIAQFNLTRSLGVWNRVFLPLYDSFPAECYYNRARGKL